VFPGLALAQPLKERDPSVVVDFAGTSRGIDTDAIPEAGFPLELLPILPLFQRPSAPTPALPCDALGRVVR
jgi:UDP-N-acetylglucosamine--N-acetylmuramyl-(pentapeptide) pyrophosphoryl-undecaprenol N-acetylglucosamine transferase